MSPDALACARSSARLAPAPVAAGALAGAFAGAFACAFAWALDVAPPAVEGFAEDARAAALDLIGFPGSVEDPLLDFFSGFATFWAASEVAAFTLWMRFSSLPTSAFASLRAVLSTFFALRIARSIAARASFNAFFAAISALLCLATDGPHAMGRKRGVLMFQASHSKGYMSRIMGKAEGVRIELTQDELRHTESNGLRMRRVGQISCIS